MMQYTKQVNWTLVQLHLCSIDYRFLTTAWTTTTPRIHNYNVIRFMNDKAPLLFVSEFSENIEIADGTQMSASANIKISQNGNGRKWAEMGFSEPCKYCTIQRGIERSEWTLAIHCEYFKTALYWKRHGAFKWVQKLSLDLGLVWKNILLNWRFEKGSKALGALCRSFSE